MSATMALSVTLFPPPAVVIHVPHASTVIPTDVTFLLPPDELERELVQMTDRYTDELFALPAHEATTVAFPVSRLVVDPERFTDDVQESMAARGMGVVYTRTADGRPLRPSPTPEEKQRLLTRFYVPHQAALTQAVEVALASHGTCLLIDGHSFPSRALPYEDNQDPNRPDICIGTDAAHTPSWLRDAAVQAFVRAGWRVAVDRPFSGALVPMRYYREDLRVRSVMLEVNRALYMDESTGAKLGSFGDVAVRVRDALGEVIGQVAARA